MSGILAVIQFVLSLHSVTLCTLHRHLLFAFSRSYHFCFRVSSYVQNIAWLLEFERLINNILCNYSAVLSVQFYAVEMYSV